jgi:hypothetical protein
VSSQPFMVKPRQVVRPLLFIFLLSLFFTASVSAAYGQFTLTVSSQPNPSAVDPGNTSVATLDLQPNGSSSPVLLTCAVKTSIPQPVGLPTCSVSPTTPITPPALPSLTITTFSDTSFGLYNIAVTGTSGSFSQTINVSVTVVNVTEDYTLSVQPTTAAPSPIHAGATATTTVTITPIGSYTGHQVTLSCLSVSPVVVAAPVCSFTPTSGTAPGPVQVTQGVPATATLTITTLGPTPTTEIRTRRIFYALWLLLPGLMLVGAFGTRNHKKKLMGLLLLLAVGCGVLPMPACGSSTKTSSNPSGQVTPKNTYTFTLTGADEHGAAPGNTSTCTTGVTCGAATVTLTVN